MLPPAVIQYPSVPSVGIVLQIHGGAWDDNDSLVADGMTRVASRWTRRGYTVYGTHYDRFGQSYASVERVYDALRARYGPRARIIVTGQSAGAHLALMLASKRHPYAAIVEGAPTALDSDNLPSDLWAIVNYVWGGKLRQYSPAYRSLAISPRRVLLSHSECDAVVPRSQMTTYARHHKGVRTFTVPCGRRRLFTHALTTDAGASRLYEAERATIR